MKPIHWWIQKERGRWVGGGLWGLHSRTPLNFKNRSKTVNSYIAFLKSHFFEILSPTLNWIWRPPRSGVGEVFILVKC